MNVQQKRSKYLKKYTLNEEDQQLIAILSGIVEGYKNSVEKANDIERNKNNAGDFIEKVEPKTFKKTK